MKGRVLAFSVGVLFGVVLVALAGSSLVVGVFSSFEGEVPVVGVVVGVVGVVVGVVGVVVGGVVFGVVVVGVVGVWL